jgi:voltage-gated potassium channel
MKIHLKFLGLLLVFSYLVCTSMFWAFEHGVNPHIRTFYDVIWWWTVTSSTVGYGDVIPMTVAGRFASVIAIIIGIYTYTNFVTVTADIVHQKLDGHRHGTLKLNCKNHIVICEYTAFADELIQELDEYPQFDNREVVIVSDLISSNPYMQHNFVCGVPINPASLSRANIAQADYIFVFANSRFRDPDLKTLHIVSRIQKQNKKATIFVELANPAHEIVRYLDNSSNIIIPMDTDQLLQSVIMNKTINLDYYINAHKLKKEESSVA